MYKYSMYGKTNKINSSFFENVVFLVETLFLFVYKRCKFVSYLDIKRVHV